MELTYAHVLDAVAVYQVPIVILKAIQEVAKAAPNLALDGLLSHPLPRVATHFPEGQL